MNYNTKDLKLASPFVPLEGEANFGPTLTKEVVGGAHIAPHCITIKDGNYILVDWKNGLPRHDKPGNRAIRFPHGLIKFGESFEECAQRLVKDQLGMSVINVLVAHIYSYLDEMNHWHMEPILITAVEGKPNCPENATHVEFEVGKNLPAHSAWRGKPPFHDTYEKFLKRLIEK